MLNLITGVFVDGFQKILKEDKEDEMMVIAGSILTSCGEDVSNALSDAEFGILIDSGAFAEDIAQLGLDPRDQRRLFQMLKANNGGQLTLAGFVEGCLQCIEPAKFADIAYAKNDLIEYLDELKTHISVVDRKLEPILLGVSRIND